MVAATQLVDEYVIRTRLDDQISAGATAAQAKLESLEAAATKASIAMDAASQSSAAAAAGFQSMVVPLVAATEAHKGFQITTRETNVILREVTLGFGTVGSAILAGVPPLQALETSFIAVGLRIATSRGIIGAFREEFVALSSSVLFWPIAAVTAIGAGLVALGVYAESTTRAHNALALSLSGSRKDYDEMATTVKAAADIAGRSMTESSKEIEAATRTIAAVPQFQGSKQALADLTETASAVARVMGTTLPVAAKLMATSLQEPAAAIAELAKSKDSFELVSGASLVFANQLDQMGRSADASKILIDGLTSANVRARTELTPLQQSLKDLSAAFTGVGTDGKSMAVAIGTAVDTLVTGAVNGITKLITALESLREKLAAMGAGAPSSGVAGIQNQGGVDLPSWWPSLQNLQNLPLRDSSGRQIFSPNVTGSPANTDILQQQIADASNASNVDPTLAYRLQQAENAPKGGVWPNSPTGAVGPFQVLQSTFAGEQSQPQNYPNVAALGPQANLGDQGTNITAGVSYISYLLNKYGDPNLAVLAYHDGEGKIDAFLKGIGQPSPEARSEASQVLSGYQGTGFINAPAGAGKAGSTLIGSQTGDQQFGPQSVQDQAAGRGAALIIGSPDQAANVAKYRKELDDLNATLAQEKDQAAASGGASAEQSAAIANTSQRIAAMRQTLDDTIDPQRKLTQSTLDHAQALASEGAGTQAVAQKELQQAAVDQAQGIAQASQATQDERHAQNLIAITALTDEQDSKVSESINTINAHTARVVAANAAYGENAAQLQAASIRTDAYNKVLAVLSKTSADFWPQVDKMTVALTNQKNAQDQTALNATNEALRNSLTYITAETASIGEDTTTRTANLAVLKEQLDLLQKFPGISQAAIQPTLDLTRAVSEATSQENLNKASMSALESTASSAFDTIGQAITQSLVNSSGQAVNWGNVMKQVIDQVINEFLKLAVIQPLMNSLFGTNGPTLASVAGLPLFGGGGGSGFGLSGDFFGGEGASSGSVESLIGIGGGLTGGGGGGGGGGIGNLLGLGNIGQQLGLTGPNGLFGELSSGLNSLLSTQVIGGFGLSSPLSAGGLDAASLLDAGGGITGSAGATLGTLLGGAGLGFGAGSFAGSEIQKLMGKTGPAPTIGSGLGSLGGALLGSIIPGLGTLLGGLLGGVLGGGLGGLIGPKPPSPYSSTNVGISQAGFLDVGATSSQLTDATAERAATIASTNAINAFLTQAGAHITGFQQPAGFFALAPPAGDQAGFQVGQNSPKGPVDVSKYASVDAAFPNLRFGIEGAVAGTSQGAVNEAISNKSFANFAALQAAVTAVDTFINTTVPALKAFGQTVGSLPTALNNINAVFPPAIAQANQYGYAVQDLTDAMAKASQTAIDAANTTVNGYETAMNIATEVAQTAVNDAGKPASAATIGDQQRIALDTFDQITSVQAVAQLKSNLEGIYGSGIDTTAEYAYEMTKLETQLGAQRLQIVSDYAQQIQAVNDNAKASVTGIVTSLSGFVTQLQTGAASPLAPQAQLSLVQSQYNALVTPAEGGDTKSIAQLPAAAQNLLAAARTVYGSGQGYVDVYNQVLAALTKVAAVPADTLTASIFATETQTQTQILNQALQNLIAQVAALNAAVAGNSNMPLRLAS